MFNEQLDNLIELALADGELTDKERSVLMRKAEAIGVDLDEFEMVLEAKLFAAKKDTPAKASGPTKKGVIIRCPACNQLAGAFETVCSQCGYEYKNVEANSSVERLTRDLQRIVDTCEEKSYKHMVGRGYGDEEEARRDDIASKQEEVIRNLPIPNSREDVLELLQFIHPRIRLGIRSEKTVFAWRTKYEEVIGRAKIAYAGDTAMSTQLAAYESELKHDGAVAKVVALYRTSSAGVKWVISMLGMMAGLGIIYWLLKIAGY